MDIQSEVLGKRCRYTFQEEDYIGRGTFGIVYRANITEPGDFIGDQDIAVKIIHLHKESAVLATTENWNKWRRRMEFLLTFQHDHLASYHQVSVARSSAFGGVSVKLMMDYYAGGDLTNLLTNASVLDVPTAIRYATELADGINYLHVNNIIHGDIKPGNVLVHRQDNHNRLLIGDLDDLVQMQQSATCSGDICNIRGTLRYMSPEMLKMYLNLSVDKVGRKSDIWSLGCVILEMINNAVGITKRKLYRAPDIGFDADKIPDSRYAALIMDGYAPLIALSIPIQLAECISSCLTASTSLRIQSSSLLDKLLSLRRLIEQQNQPLSAVAVGIHLGLSHSSVVVCRNGRLEVVTEPHQHEPQIPSFIAFDQTSESGTKILCGQEAMDHQEVDPKQCVYNLQRIIGLRFKHKRVTAQKNVATYNIVNEDGIPRIQIIERGGATTYSAEEITSLLFNNLMRLAESISAISACQTKKVVITVPTYFTVAERRAIKLAAAMAGIERVRLIDDALAAVIPCIRNFGPGKRYILVLELLERQQLIVSIVKLSNNNADLARFHYIHR
ncbi:dual specificity testis-specific protein kinase 1-like [Paramacrobiotus metropolitanus]|uniref:dual specificity testis-specific protein kinase 1-like n=1 Tax=Paramacrobiotus metropolitanus TaxID=2943436 RepID=UPI0024458EC2|nr:dual specificity testis-specific protein kinase 1-like [Paramacrobiotus metropolitanus]